MPRDFYKDEDTGEVFSITTCDDTGEVIDSRNYDDLRSAHNDGYLQTMHWQNLRDSYIFHSHKTCEKCGRANANYVMHISKKSFDNCGSENFLDLILLCSPCHEEHRKKLSNYE